jgi:hypothetical protein
MSELPQSATDSVTVYVIVHELFGIYVTKDSIALLPPDVPPCTLMKEGKDQEHRHHKYAYARYKNGRWVSPDQLMTRNEVYSIHGLTAGNMPKTDPPSTRLYSRTFGEADPGGGGRSHIAGGIYRLLKISMS